MLKKLSYGELHYFLQEQIRDNLDHIIVCLTIIMIGIATLVLVIAMRFLGIPALAGHEACGMLLITGASSLFINYKYITLIFNNACLVNVIEFILMLLIAEFLIIYLRAFVKTEKNKKVINVFISIWTSVVLLFMLLTVFDVEFRPLFEKIGSPVIIMFLIIEIYYMIKDYNHSNNESTKYRFYSGVILALVTTIEIIYYYMTNSFLAYIFKTGLFAYNIIQVGILMRYSKDSIVQAARVEEMEKKMIQSNVEIMMSQIKPHFLYNTLGTIKALCLKDVKMARSAIDYFSRYLRANMDSISEKECIPFSKELSHVKSYLYIEKLRFDELLNIKYEIETENFKCPSLLLQTMVENAVKHGICNKCDGGTVLIKTYETDDNYIIKVIDDGTGFDINSNVDTDERNHIGIENTRNRLKEMCNGKLDIESEIEKGTKVTIEIPKGVETNESNYSR